MTGKIMKCVAGFYYVRDESGHVWQCRARGVFRKDNIKPLAGDNCRFELTDTQDVEGNVTEILPRKNVLFRPEAANVDQSALVFACRDPDISLALVDRMLVTQEFLSVPCFLVFTKSDLLREGEREKLAAPYRSAGYEMVFISAGAGEEDPEMKKFRGLLDGKVTALAGPSGVGKSTLVNTLVPGAHSETGELSRRIRRGRQTTRATEMFCLKDGTWVFDTPGFSALEFRQIEKEKLELYFPEFLPYLGKCRFAGCSHIAEKDCAVKEALSEGRISASRYRNYAAFYRELAAVKRY
ncbi:MAG: ribosome small subunit-dependent GTPase A [Lachnospiraceae bacterium]|jgi:ribosome biogenesis GTPase